MEHTAKGVVTINPRSGSGGWAAGHPRELDMEAGVRGGCEVDADAEGQQEGECGGEGRHG